MRTLVPVPPDESVTLVVLSVATIPVLVTDDVSVTVPMKELTLASMIVEEPEDPA